MIPVFKLQPKTVEMMLNSPDSKERLMEVVNKYFDADKELVRVCKELGIPKPELEFINGGGIEEV